MKDLPAFVRPGYKLVASGLVERWIDECIEFKEGDNLPSTIYLKSFQEWSGCDYKLRSLNKVLKELGFYVGMVAWVKGASHRCWVSVKLKEGGEGLLV